jgi:AcrR family transcriptional regulator
MERRQESTDMTRTRIIKAARELLAAPDRSGRFSVEEVARRAGVARMTIYYQFGSLSGLLEALCDSLAMAGGMAQLADAFRSPDALAALDRFIEVFTRFWESDRAVLRSLGAFAVLDPEFAVVLEERSGWRRKGARVLLERLAKQTGQPKPKEIDEAVEMLYLLTSFSTYDTLAGTKRGRKQVTVWIQRLARQALLRDSHVPDPK